MNKNQLHHQPLCSPVCPLWWLLDCFLAFERKEEQTFSTKGQIVNILVMTGCLVPIKLLNSAVQLESSPGQYINKWVWLCFNKTLFARPERGLYFACSQQFSGSLIHPVVSWTNSSQQSHSYFMEEFSHQLLRRHFFYISVPIVTIFIKPKNIWPMPWPTGSISELSLSIS
jgi:hypothetical protein